MKLFILLLICLNLYSFEAKVIKVSDGDTISVLADGKPVKIRLDGIDAPEKSQAFGRKATKFLSNLIAGRVVEIAPQGKDRYKRVIATVYLNGININQEIIKNGYAWAFVKYSTKYLNDESNARALGVGLWSGKNPIAPWIYRKHKKR
ncbi:thermonuclease family protein [Campylobacter sp. RM12920]|uniref:Thermonuclease family protein n=1 Tax=Campylobacter californiensis TaxID=1032243 RepID=A0ABD4JJ18_9BACT|nr:thermonuclease family protein [Campylobacter sp. RM12919]MBE2988980.1 thermonuclease family protein [Campylobacter sp. RM12920]